LVGEHGESIERLNSEHLSLGGTLSDQLPKIPSSRLLSSYPDIFSTGDVDETLNNAQDLSKGHKEFPPLMSDLTGETGTYCHMAPENFRSEPYGETAETFSLGMVLYELFCKDLVFLSEMNPESPYAPKEFAYRMSKGYRPSMSKSVCPQIAAVIRKCWKADPLLRPRMREVVQELKGIRASGVLEVKRGFFSCFGMCAGESRAANCHSEAV
ncbi:unnamed protein product, partial [Ostreobium quekettii]